MSDQPNPCEPFPSKTIRDWVLGIGEFSEENLAKSRQEAADRIVEKVMAAMQKRVAEAFLQVTNHDAEPAAKAQSCEKSRPQAVSELGNPVRHSTQDGTGSTQEPVAWAVVYPNGAEAIIAWRKSDAEDMASASDRIEPLYRHPQTTLTDAERTAIKTAIVYLKEDDDFPGIAEDKATLLALLKRTEHTGSAAATRGRTMTQDNEERDTDEKEKHTAQRCRRVAVRSVGAVELRS